MSTAPITLLQLNERVQATLNSAPSLTGVWVTAETSDVRTSAGHCYMELIDKDPATGRARARLRATVWASRFARLNEVFRAATGSAITSDIKVMVCLTVSFHPIYGLSANITDIDPAYTVGDLLRRRREMIERLTAQGIINMNRELAWPAVPRRIAVISARTAAGYGDFINQLYSNRYCLRFHTRLFPALMQGDGAPRSIVAALEAIAADSTDYDCVVIIRGGGATGDLAAFDDYTLAANIAMFPLPVVIGIGHERDITLLDYVANMRVKTPTAAAEWLIGRGADALGHLQTLAADIVAAATAAVGSAHRRLDFIAGQLPALTAGVIERGRLRTGRQVSDTIVQSVTNILGRHGDRLKALGTLLDTLSPQATLRRGFSITRLDGRAVADPAEIPDGAVITTVLARGTVTSTVKR